MISVGTSICIHILILILILLNTYLGGDWCAQWLWNQNWEVQRSSWPMYNSIPGISILGGGSVPSFWYRWWAFKGERDWAKWKHQNTRRESREKNASKGCNVLHRRNKMWKGFKLSPQQRIQRGDSVVRSIFCQISNYLFYELLYKGRYPVTMMMTYLVIHLLPNFGNIS